MIATTGQRGVQLFFVVSAFTLFMSYDHRREEHQPNLNFFLRRLFRLAPMYYVATAVACILTPQYAGPWGDVVLSLLFLHGFAPHTIIHGAVGGWSVATEAVFYMCLPLLFRTIRSLTAAIWLFLITTPALFFLCKYLTQRYPSTDYYPFFWFPAEFPVFAMGIVSYYVWKNYIAGPHKGATPKHRGLSCLILVLAASMYGSNLPFTYVNLYACSAVGALLLLGLSLHPGLFWSTGSPYFWERFRSAFTCCTSTYCSKSFILCSTSPRRIGFCAITQIGSVCSFFSQLLR